jgi:tetratricopeptide (TPR) repeat protein
MGEVPLALRARALRALGGAIFITGRFEEGAVFHHESLAAYRELGDEFGIAHLLYRSAVQARISGDLGLALALAEEGRALHRGESPWAESQTLSLLANMAWHDGRQEEALDLAVRSADLAGIARSRWLQSNSLSMAGQMALEMGRLSQAEEICLGALEIARQIGDRQRIAYLLTLLAWAAADRGNGERAGRLWGAIEAEGADRPFGQWEAERETYRRHVFAADGPEFERGLLEGRSLTLDEAIDSALASEDTFDRIGAEP